MSYTKILTGDKGRNDSYVNLVEASLSRALMVLPERLKSSNDDHMRNQEYGTVPPHFYRELTRTIEGCQLLKDSGHFDAFVANIRGSWSEHEDLEIMVKLKGSLWAVGNVGSMELGAPFLEETDVVEWIVRIATSSEVMTIRGTAYYVLGLISRSLHGMEMLTEFGWTAATDHLGRSLGYCLPPYLDLLLSMECGEGSRPTQRKAPLFLEGNGSREDDPVRSRILVLISEMGNTLLYKKAAGELLAIRAKFPEQFTSTALFRKVMLVLEAHNFRLQVRRFAFELFKKGILRRIVLEDDAEMDSAPAHPRRDS